MPGFRMIPLCALATWCPNFLVLHAQLCKTLEVLLLSGFFLYSFLTAFLFPKGTSGNMHWQRDLMWAVGEGGSGGGDTMLVPHCLGCPYTMNCLKPTPSHAPLPPFPKCPWNSHWEIVKHSVLPAEAWVAECETGGHWTEIKHGGLGL